MYLLLAHALPQSLGAVPLTVILTGVIGLYLATGALGTRLAGRVTGAGSATPSGTPSAAESSTAIDDPHPPIGQLLGVVGLLLIAALATFGPNSAAENLTDVFVLTLLWGFVGISVLVAGSWWWRIDPLRGLNGLLARAVGDPGQHHVEELPTTPATVAALLGLVAWAYVQLFVAASVLVFQLLLIGYLVIHVVGATRFGVVWLQKAESLNVLSDTLGLLRPGSGGSGPVKRLTHVADSARLQLVSGALVGWSLIDLILETEWWHDLAISGPARQTAGMVALLVAMLGTGWLIRASSARAGLGPAFVAVAAAWVFAHYLSLLLIEGQGILIWLSDPFNTGADYFGRRGSLVDLEPIPLDLLATLQAIPFVLGHLGAVLVTGRRAALRVRTPSQVGQATFLARALIGVLLVGGIYLQLGGL